MKLLLTGMLALELLAPAAMAADNRTPIPAGMRQSIGAADLRGEPAAADAMTSGVASAAAPLLALLDSRPDLSLFAAALRRSGLWRDLDTNGPVILFVPSNAAMEAEGSAFLLEDVLLSEANAQRLEDLMALHLVAGAASLSDLAAVGEVATLAGDCLSLDDVGGRLRIGPQAFVVEHNAVSGSSLFVIDRLLWRPWSIGDTCASPSAF